jgi:hypothetical protein
MLKRHNGTHYTGSIFNMDIEIFKLSFLRSESFRSFFHYIDCSGGIFVHRWANPIRSLAVWALLPESKVLAVVSHLRAQPCQLNLSRTYMRARTHACTQVLHLAPIVSYAHQSFLNCAVLTHHERWERENGQTTRRLAVAGAKNADVQQVPNPSFVRYL